MKSTTLRVTVFFVLLLLFSVFPIPNATAALQSPYWLKPGAYVEYYANSTPSRPNVFGGGIYYHWDDCLANFGFQRIRVVFNVTDVSNNWALINVTVILYGDPSLRWPFSDVDAYYRATCSPPFTPINTTPYSRNNISLVDADYGKNLTIKGAYRINLNTGTVYSLDGKPYGHTFLFGLYPVTNMTYITTLNGTRLRFEGVDILNSTTYVTYYRNFTGPNVMMVSEPVNITDPSGAKAFGRTMVLFNPGEDVSPGFFGVIPDLEASVEIYALTVADNMDNTLKPQFSHGKLVKAAAPGVILYRFSYPKEESRPNIQASASPPASRTWLLALLALLVLALAFLGKRR
ncbi:hypothetical protein [Thermococcus sp. Bubb.Bath]|uniref:hypothetical protein n=1 Tax=Thermococcus sp. Bubb.Bath TaxID=1638242 RepID=UPI00143AD6B1|nr:hypothetical protein [Thermococcus sp. Bubb.Bath]NJF25496.1 hypothetical protein [Thermococcus sp. Bubb.Bath]